MIGLDRKKTAHQKIYTGGDPSLFADFSALQAEIAKLTHPARPEVDWGYVEQLAIALFQQNGVDLETAVYYTLARLHAVELAGLDEGLTLLYNLLKQQWANLWPIATARRIELLSLLANQIQQYCRSYPFSQNDLPLFYRLEQHCQRILQLLSQYGIQHASLFEQLYQQLSAVGQRLERVPAGQNRITTHVVTQLPQQQAAHTSITPSPRSAKTTTDPLYYIADTAPAARVIPQKETTKKLSWGSFALGMMTALVIFVIIGASYYWSRPDNLQQRLLSSLQPLPQPLTQANILALQQHYAHDALAPYASPYLATLSQQISTIEQLPANWLLSYADQLVSNAQQLYPYQPQTQQIVQQWQNYLHEQNSDTPEWNGYHLAQTHLQQLINRLNQLDERKGHYLTVSELKSALYQIQKPLLTFIPLSQLLMQQQQLLKTHKPIPAELTSQINARFNQLTTQWLLNQHELTIKNQINSTSR